MNTIREEFEAWALSTGFDVLEISRLSDGQYYSLNVQVGWQAWQAARQPVGENPAWRDELVREAYNRGLAEGLNADRQPAGEVVAQVVDLGKVRQLIGDLRTLDVKESTKNANAGFVDLRCYWALLGLAGEVERSMADSQPLGEAEKTKLPCSWCEEGQSVCSMCKDGSND